MTTSTLLSTNRQHGSALIIFVLVVVIAIFVIGGVYYVTSKNNIKQSSPLTTSAPHLTTTNPIKTYTDSNSGFSFDYPSIFVVQQDSEDAYSKRNNGDNRKNFSGYVQYQPGTVLSAISLLGSDNSFENSPFSVWVFDNPNNLSEAAWFNKYWYYPFMWGQFNPPEKMPLAPTKEMTINGNVVKYGTVDYQKGSPRYFYIPQSGKMILIKVSTTSNEVGINILKTFKSGN